MINHVFLIHGFIEGIFALALIFFPQYITFLSFADNYATFVARSYGAALLGSAVTALFCYSLPNMLPCKRGAAIGFMVYHGLFALFCFQSRMEGPLKTETAWVITGAHVFIFFCFYIWFKITGDQVSQFVKQSKQQQRGPSSKAN
ncbi:hypothetical protein BC941DRAFT_439160 [Chlamydoabsidia padenii]|nr:hypothetical protein BC941DRAFT_439160 [Chlamydoabsidia padenii]